MQLEEYNVGHMTAGVEGMHLQVWHQRAIAGIDIYEIYDTHAAMRCSTSYIGICIQA